MTAYTVTCKLFLQLYCNSCTKRLCERIAVLLIFGIGPSLRKDDIRDSTVLWLSTFNYSMYLLYDRTQFRNGVIWHKIIALSGKSPAFTRVNRSDKIVTLFAYSLYIMYLQTKPPTWSGWRCRGRSGTCGRSRSRRGQPAPPPADASCTQQTGTRYPRSSPGCWHINSNININKSTHQHQQININA